MIFNLHSKFFGQMNRSVGLGVSEAQLFTFLSMKVHDGQKLSAIAIYKFFHKINTSIEVKKLRNGSFLIKTPQEEVIDLLNTTQCGNTKISITKHESFNKSKGTIYSPDLHDLSSSEITEFCDENQISSVENIYKKIVNGAQQPTNIFELQFKCAKPPTKVKLGYLVIPVRILIPKPIQCFNCYKFGHGTKFCKSSSRCGNCAGAKHNDNTKCEVTSKCANCNENHPSWSKSCKFFRDQKEILRIKAENCCSYNEAKSSFFQSRRYATAASKHNQPNTIPSPTKPTTPPPTLPINDYNNLFQLLTNISQRLEKLEALYGCHGSQSQKSEQPISNQPKIICNNSNLPHNQPVEPNERKMSSVSTTSTSTMKSDKNEIPDSDWKAIENNFKTWELVYDIKFNDFKLILESSNGNKDILSILRDHNINDKKKIENFAYVLEKTGNYSKDLCHALKHRITRTKHKLVDQLNQPKNDQKSVR